MASDALIKLSTLSRDVQYETIKELVDSVVKSPELRLELPILIAYLRNHAKSLAPGVGPGEKIVPIKMLCALFEADAPMGMALVKDIVIYGCWRSLLQLLEVTNNHSKESKADEGKQDPSCDHKFSELQRHVHQLFADQLKADEESMTKGGAVSNASKYAPHEGRSHLLSYHGDCIASLLFPDEAPDLLSETTNQAKFRLRRKYRQLRVKLNDANQHIAEIYLAGKRAAELQPGMICGGVFTKKMKALLNVTKRGSERYPDAGRRMLRNKITRLLKDSPSRIPAPSDIAALADQLFKLHHNSETTDEAERDLLRASYKNVVQQLQQGILAAAQEAKEKIASIGIEDEQELAACLADADQHPLTLAIACTLRQQNTHKVSCLLAMILADTEQVSAIGKKAASPTEQSECQNRMDSSPDSPSPAAVPLILFSESAALTLDIPLAGHLEERLVALVSAARDYCTQSGMTDDDGVDAARLKQRGPSYAEALKQIDGERLSGRDVVLCSDFYDADRLAEAVRAWRAGDHGAGAAGRLLTCWRMLDSKFGRVRGRQPAWDPERPRVDVVFCMDTTGSMGPCIRNCQSQTDNILRALSSRSGVPVRCAFVSYKDFGYGRDEGGEQQARDGTPDHVAWFGWTDANDAERMGSLRQFVRWLDADGGGGAEDAAAALEQAGRLFDELREPSLRLCVLFADAPCHGLIAAGESDSDTRFEGVDQRERALEIVRRVFADGGAELLLCNPRGNMSTDAMKEAFDRVLGTAGTFVEEIGMVEHASDQVFYDKVMAGLESCVASAVAPATEALGLDCFGGTDFGVPLSIASARRRARMEALADRLAAAAAATDAAAADDTVDMQEAAPMAEEDDTSDCGSQADAGAVSGTSQSPTPTAAAATSPMPIEAVPPVPHVPHSALSLLRGRLAAPEYDLVRVTMASVRGGVYQGCGDALGLGLGGGGKPLAAAAVAALAKAGVTAAALQKAGYPEEMVAQVRDHVLSGLQKAGSATAADAATGRARKLAAAGGRGGVRAARGRRLRR